MFGIPEPELAGLAVLAGADSVILDGEHGFPLDGHVRPVVVAVNGAGGRCIVRIGKNSISHVAALADLGVDGFVLSSPDSLDEMDELARQVTFVAPGRRSVNPFVAAAGVPGDVAGLRTSGAALELWAMAESHGFLEVMRAAARAGDGRTAWTGIVIGPYDLASSLRCEPDPADPRLQTAVMDFENAAQAMGLRCGLFVRDPSTLAAWRDVGLSPDLVVIGYDRDAWFQECRRRVASVREMFPAVARIATTEGGN